MREKIGCCCLLSLYEFKGSKTHVIDPANGELIPLFNPRTQNWSHHFSWANGGTHIVAELRQVVPLCLLYD